MIHMTLTTFFFGSAFGLAVMDLLEILYCLARGKTRWKPWMAVGILLDLAVIWITLTLTTGL